jgi:hypothetical protein
MSMRHALAGLTVLAAVAAGSATAEAGQRYYYDPCPPPVRYVPAPRVYYPPPPPYYYVPGPAYVVPRPVPYGYYAPYRPYPVTSFSFTYRGH